LHSLVNIKAILRGLLKIVAHKIKPPYVVISIARGCGRAPFLDLFRGA